MGFKVARIYVLEFDGTGMEGAVVKMRSPSISTMEEWRELEESEARGVLFDHLAEWNLEDDAGPIPPTIEAIRRIEPQILGLISKEWWRAVRGLTAPLDPRPVRSLSTSESGDGEASPMEESSVPSIPMETL